MGLRFTHTWEWEREIIRPSQGKPGVAVLQRARNPRRETEKGSVRRGGGDPQAKRRPGRCRPGPPRTHSGPVLPGSGSGSFVSSKELCQQARTMPGGVEKACHRCISKIASNGRTAPFTSGAYLLYGGQSGDNGPRPIPAEEKVSFKSLERPFVDWQVPIRMGS
eukprot:bmy_09780T0